MHEPMNLATVLLYPLLPKVAHLFNEARYGEDPDQVGVLRLLTNGTFSTSYPLHEVRWHL